jgi:hypothetical protein
MLNRSIGVGVPGPTDRASRGGQRETKGERYAQWPKYTGVRLLNRANELAKKTDKRAREINGGPHRLRPTFASHFLADKPDLFALGRVLDPLAHARDGAV